MMITVSTPHAQGMCSFCSMSYTDGEGHDYEQCLSELLERRDGVIDHLADLTHSIQKVRRIVDNSKEVTDAER